MLAVAYKINEVLVRNYEEAGDTCSGSILIGLTIMFSSISLVWIGFQYYWYHGCGYNYVLITITFICGVAFYALVFIRTRPDASLLTSSVVFLYVTYLLWSALASNPNKDPECNPFAQSGTNTAL